METFNAAGSEMGKSTLIVLIGLHPVTWHPMPGGVRFLWGERLAGNPFEMAERGSGKRHNYATATNGKPQTARGKPVSHEHHTDHPDQRARDHVAGMMGQQHEAAGGNQDGIDY